MLNPDSKNNAFEDWLSAGLKERFPVSDHFTRQLLDRFEEQKAHPLPHCAFVHKAIFGGLSTLLTLSGFGILLYLILSSEMSSLLNNLWCSLIQVVSQPSLESFAVPAAVALITAVILWNLIEMLSLE